MALWHLILPAASVAQECHPNIPLLWRAVQGRVPTFMRVFSALSILPASFYKLILETSELCLLAFDLLVSFLYACQCNCMCVWPSFFLFAFFFLFFFSLFPFTAFPTELLPGWLILILTLLINWLFFKVISICPSAGGTASSQHSLANPSSSLCRLPLVQVMVLFGPDDKAWAKWLRIMGSFQGEQAAGPFTHSFVSYVHTFSVTTYPKLMLTPAVRRQNWGAKKKKRSYICLRKCEW